MPQLFTQSKQLIILFTLLISIFGCESSIYNHNIKIPNYTWERSNKLVYKIDIKEPIDKAKVTLNVRHATDLPYSELLINVKLTTPKNEKGTRLLKVPTKNAEGKNIGSGMGDMWDVKAVIENSTSFQVGTYEIELTHQMPDNEVFMLIDMGIKIEKGE